MDSNYLNAGLEGYLSPQAKEQVEALTAKGLDFDIAFEMVASDESALELPLKKEINGVTTWTK